MKVSIWYYDELKQVGVDYTDKKQVEEYDSGMQKLRDIKNEAKEIVAAVNLQAEQVIIEIGTGTGEFALEVSKYCKSYCSGCIKNNAGFRSGKSKNAEEKQCRIYSGRIFNL